MSPYPGDRVAHVGYLVGECRVRLQPVVRAHANKAAPVVRCRISGRASRALLPEWKPPPWKCSRIGALAGPVAAVIYVQRAVRPVAVGQAAYPDHVEPAGEERGAQDAAPRPPRLTGVAQCRVRAQRAAHDDYQAGQGEQRDNGGGGAGRGAKVTVGERDTVEAISRYPARNGSSLTTSAGRAAKEPSRATG